MVVHGSTFKDGLANFYVDGSISKSCFHLQERGRSQKCLGHLLSNTQVKLCKTLWKEYNRVLANKLHI